MKVFTPWTEQQVRFLRHWQECGEWHPYTCGKCRAELIPTPDGWVCDQCDYTQDWALIP